MTSTARLTRAELAAHIRDVQDYPAPGILFKDITGLLVDANAFRGAVEALAETVPEGTELIAGTEARGFIFGAALAARLGLGFVPVRKAGKLPPPVHSHSYDLEYGRSTLEIREGTVATGARVLLVDDVLATGGTAAAAAVLLETLGADVVALAFLLEIDGLGGRERLAGRSVSSILRTEP